MSLLSRVLTSFISLPGKSKIKKWELLYPSFVLLVLTQVTFFVLFCFLMNFVQRGQSFLSAFVYFAHCLSLGFGVSPLHEFRENNSSPKNSSPKFIVSPNCRQSESFCHINLNLRHLSYKRVWLCHAVYEWNLHLFCFYYLWSLVPRIAFCIVPWLSPYISFPSVQPHEVCREPAGDDQLSHGMLSLPCETGCVVFLLSFHPPL